MGFLRLTHSYKDGKLWSFLIAAMTIRLGLDSKLGHGMSTKVSQMARSMLFLSQLQLFSGKLHHGFFITQRRREQDECGLNT
jgi:hypothetical protein